MDNGHAAQNGVNGVFLDGSINQMGNVAGSPSSEQQVQMGQQAMNAMPMPQGYAPVEQMPVGQQYPQGAAEIPLAMPQGYEQAQPMMQPMSQDVQGEMQPAQQMAQPEQQAAKQDVVEHMKRGVKIMKTISSESVADMDSLCAKLGNGMNPYEFYENADAIIDSTVDSNYGVKVDR